MIDLAFITNVVTSLFCAAVLVQTVRLSRAVHTLRHAGLIEVVASLEAATDTSQRALGELTAVLRAEGPPLDAAVRGARDLRVQLITLRDELSLMIDIGNGVAERILAAANDARGPTGDGRAMAASDAAAAEPENVGATAGGSRGGQPASPPTAQHRQPGGSARVGPARAYDDGEANGVTGGTDAPFATVTSDGGREVPFSATMPPSAAAKDSPS